VVSVSAGSFGNPVNNYVLPAMTSVDDIWEVCNITYPSGEIETIDEYLPRHGLALRESEVK
jgi:hypothetical protein